MILIDIQIYRDSTRLFSREECDEDNEFHTQVPKEILLEYFIKNIKDSFKTEEIISDEELMLEWLDEYTLDATDGLWDFCKDRGFEPEEYNALLRMYAYDIWDGDKGIIFAKNYTNAVELFRENYSEVPIADVEGIDYDSGVCRLEFYAVVPRKEKLMFMYD